MKSLLQVGVGLRQASKVKVLENSSICMIESFDHKGIEAARHLIRFRKRRYLVQQHSIDVQSVDEMTLGYAVEVEIR